mmetsp:Transcript_63485/g.194158  ORF Transcript_63485/g.194158 Transcript_63485/m.194158 type:complete len:229 (+) Transcript_63485:535-1221(+)
MTVYECISGVDATTRQNFSRWGSLTNWPPRHMTLISVSSCQRRSGAYLSTAMQILLHKSSLKSVSATNRQFKSSLIMPLMFSSLMSAYATSNVRFLIDMSESFKHSMMVVRWRCTAFTSIVTTRCNVESATYRMLLSRLKRKRPRMLIASTLKPLSASMDMIVKTHSYNMALPVFFAPSVFVATCARMSFISSLASTEPVPSKRRRRSIFACKKGSVMPAMSYSAALL